MSTTSRKRQRTDGSEEGAKKREGLSAADYVEMVLHSLGYDEVSSDVKEQFKSAIQQWMNAVCASFTKDGTEYPIRNYLHQIYPDYWSIYKRYYLSKQKSSNANTEHENEEDSDLLERLEEDEEEKGVNTSMQLSSSVSSILENHNNFLSKRSMILDKDFYPLSRKQSYTPSMIPRCLNQLSSSDSFITRQFQACSSNALCQFTNLLLFYRLCSQISKLSNLYNVKEEEVEEELKNWGVDATDMDKLDVNDTLDKAVLSLKAQKRKPRGELKTVECQKDEYDFIKELL
ncbi:hypothetical protein AV274_5776 [Blastocystis sp. ATCC 50177/Nand II]|uniref:Uncharacterized protein n=1 Tax=Blastocystis sp. subtype 1 (strain ATCC 50177 / NandII) TaxID=478820 RepID=A0A196S635_BLAHN|nr:hypothetical protein AV274_5776 [Blastocystis sp. ATCC 50177/Nand II]